MFFDFSGFVPGFNAPEPVENPPIRGETGAKSPCGTLSRRQRLSRQMAVPNTFEGHPEDRDDVTVEKSFELVYRELSSGCLRAGAVFRARSASMVF